MMCVWAECRIPSIRANGGATAWLVGGLWAVSGGAKRAASGGMGVWRELVAGGDIFSGFDAFTLTISLSVPPAPDVIGAAAGPPPSAAARSLLSARREAAATRVGVSWRSTARLVPAHHACLCVCVREAVLGRPRCLHPCVVTPGGGFPISQRAPRGRCSAEAQVCAAGIELVVGGGGWGEDGT